MEEHLPQISLFRGIYNQILVYSEQIAAANPLSLVRLFAFIGYLRTDDLTHILNDHLASGNSLHRVETPVMDRGACKSQMFLPRLKLIELEAEFARSGLPFRQCNGTLNLIDFLQALSAASGISTI